MGAVSSVANDITGAVKDAGNFLNNTVKGIERNPWTAIADATAIALGQPELLPLINPAIAIAQGQDPTKIAESAAIGAALGPLSSGISDVAGTNLAGNFASGAIKSGLSGQNMLAGGINSDLNTLSGDANSAIKDYTGVSGLPTVNFAKLASPVVGELTGSGGSSMGRSNAPLAKPATNSLSAQTDLPDLTLGNLGMSKLGLSSLDPNAQTELKSKNTAGENGVEQVAVAHGGSIDMSKMVPELMEVLQRHIKPKHFDQGGSSVWDNPDVKAIDWKTMQQSFTPTFAKTYDPTLMTSKGSNTAGVKINPLTSLAQGPLSGLIHKAKGGLSKYHEAAPEGHHPEFITGVTGYYAGGRGTGQSDDIPAMLHNGDYVIDAEAVSALGDGSSKAGNDALMKFMHQVPHEKKIEGEPVPAKIADGEVVLPSSFVTALGHGDNKFGAKMLDAMREELREHKRSAPTSKIPPKAKSPLDYLKMAKG